MNLYFFFILLDKVTLIIFNSLDISARLLHFFIKFPFVSICKIALFCGLFKLIFNFVSSELFLPKGLPAIGLALYPNSLSQTFKVSIQYCSLSSNLFLSGTNSITLNEKFKSPYLFHTFCKYGLR